MFFRIFAFVLTIFASSFCFAGEDNSGELQVGKFSYMRSGDILHIRVEQETYRLNYDGYFDFYYGMGYGLLRRSSDKTITLSYYPHVGIRGYSAVAPFFEVGADFYQIVFLPGNMYAWNKFDPYYKAGISWDIAPNVGMELFWQHHDSLFQKSNSANFIGWSMYVRVDK